MAKVVPLKREVHGFRSGVTCSFHLFSSSSWMKSLPWKRSWLIHRRFTTNCKFFRDTLRCIESLFGNFAWHWTSTHVLSAQTNNRSIQFLTPARSLIFTPFLFKRKIPFDDNSNTQFFLRIERFLGQHSLDAGLNQLENNFVSRLIYEHLSLKEYFLKTFQVF